MGVATDALIWSSSALVGISFLFEKLSWLYQGLRLFGGAYLVYLGIEMWFHAAEPQNLPPNPNRKVRDTWSYFRVGLMTNLAIRSRLFSLAASSPIFYHGRDRCGLGLPQ